MRIAEQLALADIYGRAMTEDTCAQVMEPMPPACCRCLSDQPQAAAIDVEEPAEMAATRLEKDALSGADGGQGPKRKGSENR